MNKRYSKKRNRLGLKIGAVVSSVAVIAACFGFASTFAGAHGSSDNTFGLSSQVVVSELSDAVSTNGDQAVYEQTVLAGSASRDISKGIQAIETAEAAKAAEEEARIAEERAAAEAAAVSASQEADDASDAVVATVDSAAPAEEAGGWQTGTASAYNIASCYGSTATASGATLTEDSVTVAVPASQSYLMGRSVEIKWNGMTVVATVTDTGGFGAYGRALDLAPGVCKAFGIDTSGAATNCNRWGVQTVQYRFL